VIRTLTDDDIDAYIALRQRALRECPLAFASSPENDFASSHEVLEAQLDRAPDWMLFGAFEDETLAGTVGLFRTQHPKSAHWMQLWGMYVAPERRSRGLGERLLEAAIAHARGVRDVAWIDLGVTTAAEDARRLYERAGFTIWGTQPEALRYEGHAVDQHYMALRLR
jgi:GNAT superfamily N-acetyltransferase